MGLLDVSRQAEQAQLARDASRSRHGILNDDQPLQRAMRGGSMYGSLMQDPADKARMDRQMLESTLAMMPMAGMTTYHGSPHLFNKFRMDKIGTGEGAQAYGHGLYFAENPNVAKEYQRNTAQYGAKIDGKEVQFPGADNETLDALTQWFGSRPKGATIGQYLKDLAPYRNKKDRLLENSAFYLERAADRYGHGAKISPAKNSNLYKVDLPDKQIENMLDWDKPLSEQPKSVMDAVDKILPKSKRDSLAMRGLFGRDDYTKFHTGKTIAKPLGELTGKEIQVGLRSEIRSAFGSDAKNYREALGDADKFLKAVAGREKNSDSLTSAVLKREGIPGIKYLDQGSRGVKGGELLDTFQKNGKWHTKIRGYDHTDTFRGEPASFLTTSQPFNTRDEALAWADKKINIGTRNFVVFDENIPQILERNQQPIGGLLGK
jgi:hypothetical protein